MLHLHELRRNFCTQKKNPPRAEMASLFFKGRATTKYPKSAVFCCLENVLIEFFKTKSSVFKQKYQHFHFGMVVFFNVEEMRIVPTMLLPKT